MLNINDINFDKETGNYPSSYYFDFLAKWPELFIKAENNTGIVVGYIMGKVCCKIFFFLIKKKTEKKVIKFIV